MMTIHYLPFGHVITACGVPYYSPDYATHFGFTLVKRIVTCQECMEKMQDV